MLPYTPLHDLLFSDSPERDSQFKALVMTSGNRSGLDVKIVHLKLGVFSDVDKAALLFSYELACEGTRLQRSRLQIETIPLVIYCKACQKNRTPSSVYQLCCPDCQTPGQTIVSGREIEVAFPEVAA
jgi:hydrogenase nickel incorporation protein HypA/HybF